MYGKHIIITTMSTFSEIRAQKLSIFVSHPVQYATDVPNKYIDKLNDLNIIIISVTVIRIYITYFTWAMMHVATVKYGFFFKGLMIYKQCIMGIAVCQSYTVQL